MDTPDLLRRVLFLRECSDITSNSMLLHVSVYLMFYTPIVLTIDLYKDGLSFHTAAAVTDSPDADVVLSQPIQCDGVTEIFPAY